MQAVILAGGKGTRLKPLTYSIPKPLLPIGKQPILEIIINNLKAHSIEDVILTVQYKADLIRTYFKNGDQLGVRIKYHEEEKPTGTAGPLKLVEQLLNNEPFIAMNGDLLTDLNFAEMVEFHSQNKGVLTVATAVDTMKSPYGIISFSDDGMITGVDEKPTYHFCVNAGIYVISPEALSYIPKSGKYFDMTSLINRLISGGENVLTYPIAGEWHDLGTMESYQNINELRRDL